jgi:glycosyltransferase involved in cell wall biosynthesis
MHDLILNIVGRGDKGPYSELINDSTTNFIGEVEDVTPWYRKCNVAIAPLLQGSGTRLKILEAMSLGNPMVSTAIGAEGIECIPERDILIADEPADFADKIISLVSDPGKSTLISDNARKLVEDKYSWNVIGSSLKNFLEK